MDLHDLRNSPTHKRDRPWTSRLAWALWDVWFKVKEMGTGLSHAWASIHQQRQEIADLRGDVQDLRHENAVLRDRLNEIDARTQHLRIFDETKVA